MSTDSITIYKEKLISVDYLARLKLVYAWSKSGNLTESSFLELINYSVDLDLYPIED